MDSHGKQSPRKRQEYNQHLGEGEANNDRRNRRREQHLHYPCLSQHDRVT